MLTHVARRPPIKMAKSKNHTNHNQNRKAHRNGIKKPKTNKYPSLKGVDPKFVRNQRYAKHGTEKAVREARAAAASA
ncbi:60S ribosomal protein L29 [Tilletia horrida]|nr:60S ribosomal protein L29 [Tilletia horrida]